MSPLNPAVLNTTIDTLQHGGVAEREAIARHIFEDFAGVSLGKPSTEVTTWPDVTDEAWQQVDQGTRKIMLAGLVHILAHVELRNMRV